MRVSLLDKHTRRFCTYWTIHIEYKHLACAIRTIWFDFWSKIYINSPKSLLFRILTAYSTRSNKSWSAILLIVGSARFQLSCLKRLLFSEWKHFVIVTFLPDKSTTVPILIAVKSSCVNNVSDSLHLHFRIVYLTWEIIGSCPRGITSNQLLHFNKTWQCQCDSWF